MMKALVLFGLLLLAIPARAAEEFIPPSYADLARTLVRFKAIDTGNDAVIDDYGAITECKLYQAFYRDDFKWNTVRGALREDIRNHGAEFPAAYGYAFKLALDRYDFQDKLFRLSDRTPIHNVNAFQLFKAEGSTCGLLKIRQIPGVFRAVLATPVFIPGLPLSPAEADALVKRMQAAGNAARAVYARFNLRIVYIEPLKEPVTGALMPANAAGPAQSGHMPGDPLQIDARLDSVDFFEDEDLTKLIYAFKP